jgi:hypothetical protein
LRRSNSTSSNACGRREGLWRVDAHLVAEQLQQAAGVELHPLAFLEPASAREERLEAIGVFLDCPRAAALGELEQWGGPQHQAETLVQEFLKAPPWRRALVLLELDEPQLGHILEVV